MNRKFLTVFGLVGLIASAAVAQDDDCSSMRKEWVKHHQGCIAKLKTDATVHMPSTGFFKPGSEFEDCYNEEKRLFPDFVGENGACANYTSERLNKMFNEGKKFCIGRSNMDKCKEFLADKKVDNIRNAEGATLLMVAAQECDEKAFDFLIEAGASLKKSDHKGNTPLQYLAMHEFIDSDDQSVQELNQEKANASARIAKKMVKLGANVNDVNLTGHRSVSTAVMNGNLVLADELMKAGANPYVGFSFDGRNVLGAFQSAVLDGVIFGIEFFLDHGVNPNRADNEKFTTWGLVWTGSNGAKPDSVGDEIARVLLKNGLDPNGYIYADHRSSAFVDLLRASAPKDIIHICLSKGVDFNKLVWNNEPWDPMPEAIEKNNMDLFTQMVRSGYDLKKTVATLKSDGEINAFEFAVISKRKDMVQALLKNKVDVNRKIPTNNGFTYPICLAAAPEDNAGVLKLLLDAKANVKVSCGGASPLEYAINNLDEDAVKLLVAAKADVNAKTASGSLILEYAQDQGNQNIINMLKKAGARAPFRGDFVSFCANPDITEEMILGAIKDGADVNDVNKDDWTPLHAVAWYAKDVRAAQVLIKNGAFVNSQTKDGMTPFLIAAKYNKNASMIKLLITSGADTDARDAGNNNWDALQDAVAMNNSEVVTALLNAGLDRGYTDSEKNLLVRIAVHNNDDHRVLSALLKRGYHAEPVNSWQDKPLHLAVSKSRPVDVIKVLLGSGAIVDNTVMEYAKNLPMGTSEQKKYRNQVIDILTKAKKKNRR